MGEWISVQGHQTLKVWSTLIEECEMHYNPEALENLLTWAKDNGFDTTKEAVLDLNTWV